MPVPKKSATPVVTAARRSPPLIAAGTALLPTAASRGRPDVRRRDQRGLRRWRQLRRAVHQRLHRAVQPRQRGRQTSAGWSVQYASSTGTSWQVTPLTGSVPAGGFYLIAEGAGAGNGAALPTPNATGTIALSRHRGKVALVNNATALTGCAATCDSAAGVVDFLGFGTANDAAGTPTPALTNTTSDQRTITPVHQHRQQRGRLQPAPRPPRPPPAAPAAPAAGLLRDADPAGVRARQHDHPGRPGHRLPVAAGRPDRRQGRGHRHRTRRRQLVQGLLDAAGPARTPPGPAPRPACSCSAPPPRSRSVTRCW